jgi:DNA-binding CsgD family transcriptional regulator
MALGLAVFGLVGYTTVRVQMNFVIGASTELAVALTAAVAWFIGNSTHQSRLVGRGLSNSEIAAELYLSVTTVKTCLTRLLAKLDARDRVQLVILAYESGLVIPPR